MKSFPAVLCFAAFYFPSFSTVGKTVRYSQHFCAPLCCKQLYLHNPRGAEQAGDIPACSPASPAAGPKRFEGNVRHIGGGLVQACSALGPGELVTGSVCGKRCGSRWVWRAMSQSAVLQACWDTWQPGTRGFAWVSTCNCSHMSTRCLIQRLCGISPLSFTTHTAQWDVFSSHSRCKHHEDLP